MKNISYALPSGDTIDYPSFVATLAKPGDVILATLTGDKTHAWHMASCIPGEAGELFAAILDHMDRGVALDRVNLIEELGDIEYYVEGLRAIMGIVRAESISLASLLPTGVRTPKDVMYDLPVVAADVFDVTKKWVIYNKPIDLEALRSALARLEIVLRAIRLFYDTTLDEVLAANVMKLGTRYTGLVYSDAAAQARADKTVH